MVIASKIDEIKNLTNDESQLVFNQLKMKVKKFQIYLRNLKELMEYKSL